MKTILKRIATRFILLLGVCGTAAAQMPDLDALEFTTTDLGHGIYMLRGFGGNIGVSIGDDGVFVIDDDIAPLTPKVIAAIGALTDRPVDFLINTHWHSDHTGANQALAVGGAVIVAHDNVRVRMAADGPKQSPKDALPVITFSDNVTFHFNGLEIFASHPANAHTDGDAVIQFIGLDIIHSGDIMFNGLFPFIDLDSGGSIDGYITALEALEQMVGPDTVIISGHGPIANKADVNAKLAMLKDSRDIVSKLIEEGMTLEQVKAAEPLAKFHADWDWSFITTERMTETFYRGLTAGE
jgi:glyoxylase-like metal-dependent hydrolase (beta-lactamase superfamily II)